MLATIVLQCTKFLISKWENPCSIEKTISPYMFGVFVLAGLIAVPLIWGRFIDLSFDRLIVGSMIGCFIFAQAHTRTGEFLFGRFIVGMLVGFLLTLMGSMTANAYVPGGLLGFAMMAGGGWLGLWLGRFTGITYSLDNADPTVLQTHDNIEKPAEILVGNKSPEPLEPETPKEEYLFGETDYRRLMKRSQQAWIDGDLSDLSDKFAAGASDMSQEEFNKSFDSNGLGAREVFDFAFKHNAPLDDEFVIAAANGGVQLSFALTNKYIYFFGLDDRLLANKFENGRLDFGNIQECRLVKKGWIYNRIEIVVRSGKAIPLKVSSSDFPMDYLAKMIEKNG